ncbi:unnamed protein product [Brassica rapa subsp. narinosa]|uniref:(rape) hypothetical protein n=1 Tax=Brassica napus TaxID=3708 RepID=A0A816P010_BRANA|nr:unnamed protein product [Brassica napus]
MQRTRVFFFYVWSKRILLQLCFSSFYNFAFVLQPFFLFV